MLTKLAVLLELYGMLEDKNIVIYQNIDKYTFFCFEWNSCLSHLLSLLMLKL